MKCRLYIVVPCYNEEAALPETASRLRVKMGALIDAGKIAPDSRVCFVNDGSRDGTWALIEALHAESPLFSGLNLSRNRGHQNALLAGLMTVKDAADVTISMDADLQDDIDAIDEMIDLYHKGVDIVYGVRSKRQTDTAFKRGSAEMFYKLMASLGVESVYNHADYRLMSRRALQALSGYEEVNLFLRGIVPLIGFPTAIVTYARSERVAGESKYPFKKMLAFAIEGVTSFSVKPLRFVTGMGLTIFLVSIAMFIYILTRFFAGETVVGWASNAVSIWAIGGLILLSLGVIGEYVGKTYMEVKGRPRYVVESFLDAGRENKE